MSDYSELDKKQDVHVLHSMGYAQELERRMSSFSNFAISFSIICILSGGINSLAQATSGAGGAAIGIGWPVGCLMSGSLHWHGADFIGLSNGWRPLSLGLHPRQPLYRLADRLAQPARPDHRSRRHQHRHALFFVGRSDRNWALKTRADQSCRSRGGYHGVAGGRQPRGYRPDGQAHRFLGLSDPGSGIALTIACLPTVAPSYDVSACSRSPTIPVMRAAPCLAAVSIACGCLLSVCCCRSTRSPATMRLRIHRKKR
jgi:hypothetical protein